MTAYKLVRKLKDGSLSPLFINKKLRIPFDVWLDAEEHPTKGYAFRPGWHCCLQPTAPHLSKKNRVWVKCEITDYDIHLRPESQGAYWALAQKIRFIEELQ